MPEPTAPTHTPAPRAADPEPTLALTGAVVDTPGAVRAPDLAPGYVVLYEIARGGMGRVVAARDPRLSREVAIKFLLPSTDPSAAARFVREAEVTARLPHPGVPPVYALGRTPTGQPFLVMKLVRGRTLADLLASRRGPADDLPRFVAVFEQVCQAVGYAHSQGVTHRDLKPGNVMVGAFGEVQVMDWGLALQREERGGRREERSPESAAVGPSPLLPPPSSLTLVGTVLGTPGYMAPEQARGEPIDARADVFALGGILAAVLTGKQPVPDAVTAVSAAADGIAAAAGLREVVAAGGTDQELSRLAYRCLSPDPDGRPADGKAVAEEVAAYRARAEDRARRAESARAAAVARTEADAHTRRARAGLVAAVVLLGAVVGATAWWRDRVERDRRQAADHAAAEQARAEFERGTERAAERRSARDAAAWNLELADDLRTRLRFDEAARAVDLADKLATRVGADDLGPRVARSKAHLDTVRALDAARTKQLVWVPAKDGLGRFADASADFARAFRAAGVDPSAEDLRPLAERVAASPLKPELVAALDDWAAGEPDRVLQARVLEVARQADPGPWTDRLRDPAVRGDAAAVAGLAADADPERLTPGVVVALARVMLAARLDPAPVLLRAHAAHPADFRIAFHLGDAFTGRDPRRAVGFYRAARALRPDNFAANINLGAALMAAGDPAGASDAYQAAYRIDRASPMAAYNLGRALAATGDPLGAAALFARAAAGYPGYANAHLELIRVLEAAGDRAAAVEAARAAAALLPESVAVRDRLFSLLDAPAGVEVLRELAGRNPDDASLRTRLGGALVDAGRVDEGIAVLRDAARLAPGEAAAYHFLGIAFIKKRDEATAARWLRKAAELAPTDPWVQTRLGGTLVNTGRVDEGLAALRVAVRLDPAHAVAHQFLGVALARKREFPAAVAAYRRAVELDPGQFRIHYNLGTTLLQAGDPAGAAAALREATRRDPNDPEAWTNLGNALTRTGRPADAADAYRTALQLVPNFPPAAAGLGGLDRVLAP